MATQNRIQQVEIEEQEEDYRYVHPLRPLSEREVAAACSAMEHHHQGTHDWRFITVQTKEPEREIVLRWIPGESYSREAFLVLLNLRDRGCYEAIVCLNDDHIQAEVQKDRTQPRRRAIVRKLSFVADAHPAVTPDEYEGCENAVKKDSRFIEALKKRGIHGRETDIKWTENSSSSRFGFSNGGHVDSWSWLQRRRN